MVQLLETSTQPRHDPGGSPVTGRALRRPGRGLPGGRAVVGGFLVAAAGVGVFGAHTTATAGPTSRYVVAARDVAPGEPLEDSAFDLVAVDLPEGQRAQAFSDVAVLREGVALGPLTRGQLVQAGDVARDRGGPTTVQISFSVAAGDALFGDVIRDGERVDLVAVYGTGEDADVETIAHDALVVDSRTGDRSVGDAGGVIFIVAVHPDEVEGVAKATAAGTVKVVRTTGSAGA
jgi:hypothetical protein